MGTNSEYYQELEKVGFQQKNDKSMMDYCLPGGYDLSGSMVATPGTPNLQADAARVAMAAVWFGSEESAFKKMNTDKKRTTKYSFYEKRKSSSVNRYVGDETSPGENESKVVFLDKLQRIYPTQKDSGDADGKMGASSKGFRTDQGQRGSQCFRPEDIPNWSSEGDTNKSEWPLGLQGSVEDHYGETRWAIWNRRIACHCEDFGLILGCLNMNDGDSDETVFAGVKEVLEMPPAVKKAIPLIKGYANEQTPPDSPGNADNGLDLNDLTVDVAQLGSGKVNTQMPQGQEQANSPGEQIQQGQDLIICMLAEDRDGKPEEQQQQQQEGQEQANNENPEGGNEAAPGAAPPAAAPPPIFGPGGNPFGPGGINFGPGITPIGGGNQV